MLDSGCPAAAYLVFLLRYLYMGKQDTLQGSLPLLVLKILVRRGPLHGYGITALIEAASSLLRVEEGSLYPALHRMEEAGWIRAKWTTTENKRRARIYEITAAGRKQLGEEEHRWTSIAAAISQLLEQA
jgi:PadR family transcriptional regulator PadR